MKLPILVCVFVAVCAQTSKPVPRFTVDLDMAPEQRWTEVIAAKADAVKVAVDLIKLVFSPYKAESAALLAAVKLPQEYQNELRGIADALGQPYTYEDVVLANLFNALMKVTPVAVLPEALQARHSTDCTSIVAQRSNGTIYHARNQDYPDAFRPLVVDVTFTRGGVPQYVAAMFAGCVGISGSALRFGEDAFSFSVNARDDTDPSQSFNLTMAAAAAGAVPVTIPARAAFDSGLSYTAAVASLSSAPILTSVYYITAGTQGKQGAVISRNRTAAVDTLVLGEGQAGGQDWFVLQTNDDNWQPPKDPRRAAGLASMKAIGADAIDLQQLFGVLSTPPVFAPKTIHTELMAPTWGEFDAFLRYQNDTA